MRNCCSRASEEKSPPSSLIPFNLLQKDEDLALISIKLKERAEEWA